MATLGFIEYADAPPEVKAVYDDIMISRQTDYINNFWKALAHDPATLRRTWESVKQIMAPGALDPLTKEMVYLAVSTSNQCGYCIASHTVAARKAGKIRFIGFTGHKDPGVHLYMLETAKRHGFRFDTVQMPLNLMDTHFRSFEKKVLPELVAAGIGVLGMKSMGDGVILKSGALTPVECLHYALSLPTSVVITGIDSMKILKQAFTAAATFTPLSKPQTARLRAKTSKLAMDGGYELFKTTSIFDSTAAHPEWLGEEPARTLRLAGL